MSFVLRSLQYAGVQLSLGDALVTAGRAEENQLVIDDPTVSRHHAVIQVVDGSPVVTDLGSTSGTAVNGQLIQRAQLNPGDVVRFGNSEWVLEATSTKVTVGVVTQPSPANIVPTPESIPVAQTVRPLPNPNPSLAPETIPIELPVEADNSEEAPLPPPRLEETLSVDISSTALPSRYILRSVADLAIQFPVVAPQTTIGRDESNQVRLTSLAASRQHARLHVAEKKLLVDDSGSTSGTFVNGKRIQQAYVKPGDVLTFGNEKFQLVDTFKGQKKSRWWLRPAIAVAALLAILFVIGIVTTPQAPGPVFSNQPGPLILLSGSALTSEEAPVSSEDFRVSLQDDTGIERVEIYVEGQLFAAKNLNASGGEPVEVQVASLQSLPAGGHNVFVRAYGTNGTTSQSAIVPVIVDLTDNEHEPVIEPAANQPPPPAGVTATVNLNGDEVTLGWQNTAANVAGYRVYSKWPDAAGLVQVAELPPTATGLNLPAEQPGFWEYYTASVDAAGHEGPLSKTTVLVPDPSASQASLAANPGTWPSFELELRPSSNFDRIYAYVRLGSSPNRYQRVPASDFIYPASDGVFRATVPALDWPADQPLLVEAEAWGWLGGGLVPLGSFSQTIQPDEVTDGVAQFSNSSVTANLKFLMMADLSGASAGTEAAGAELSLPRPIDLPPPGNLRVPRTVTDCWRVATEWGDIQKALQNFCNADVTEIQLYGDHAFILWDWPIKDWAGTSATEDDIAGFEIMFKMSDATGQVIGQSITAVPYAPARGWGLPEVTKSVGCGVKREWLVRAVSAESRSEWIPAFDLQEDPCEPPPTGFQPNGCGGGPTKEIVPELWFHEACNRHDWCYDRERSGMKKEECDNEFYYNLVKTCTTTLAGIVTAPACLTMTQGYYYAVTIAGRLFYKGETDVWDCFKVPAVDYLVCLLSYPDQEWQLLADGTIKVGGYIADGTVWAAKKTWDGTTYVAGTTWDGTKWTGGKIADGASAVANTTVEVAKKLWPW